MNTSAPLRKVSARAFILLLVRYVTTRTTLVVWASVVWVAISTIVSLKAHDWGWFQRSGPVLTVAAVAMAGRAMIRAGRAGLQKSAFMIVGVGKTSVDSKTGKMMAEPIFTPEQKRQQREERRDETAAILGFLFAVLGTAIWGYGDLFNLFYPHH